MLNGINCGGCAKALTQALLATEGVNEVHAESKSDTGTHPHEVVVTGSCSEELVLEVQEKQTVVQENKLSRRGRGKGKGNGAVGCPSPSTALRRSQGSKSVTSTLHHSQHSGR